MAEHGLPTGTVTLLLADIEGSVKLWESRNAGMTEAMKKYDGLVGKAITRHGGVKPKDQGEGDSFLAAFARPSEAVGCALAIQLALRQEDWGGFDLRARMALHSGEVELRDEANYLGSTINRCARLRSLARGGQVLLSAATFDLVTDRLPEGASIKDLGMHRLKDLSRPEHVYQLSHAELHDAFPPLRSLEALPNNLPVQLTSFVGREKDIEEVNELLRKTRMLTLTGSGGCGKTRLALQVAADLVDQFERGVWLADLASVTDASLVPAAVASALRLPEERERDSTATLTDHIEDASALIVLDNCEHLVHACADLSEVLLRACPSLTIIATSREPLGVDGETAWRVPSLSLPDESERPPVEALAQFEAVRLFVERAVKSRPNFRITNENAPAVVEICHRLDGIPLAIELAAARVRVLSPEEIADGLANRFHLLTGGARTAMPRQRTLQASVEWSYDLLSEHEQLLLNSLSVFAGGFTLDAAEAVGSSEQVPAAQVLDLLSQLIDKSLVLVEDLDAGASRYRMLETIRQYAMDRCLEAFRVETVRERHMQYFLELAESRIYGRGKSFILSDPKLELVAEVDNLRAAARWALSHEDPNIKLRMAAMTALILINLEHQREARALVEEALASAEGASPTARGRGLVAKAYAGIWGGGAPAARSTAEEALQLADETGDTGTATDARLMVAQYSFELGDGARLRSIVDEIRATSDAGSADQGFADVMLGVLLLVQGEFAESKALLAEGEGILRANGDLLGLANTLVHIPYPLLYLGEFDRAQSAAAEGQTILRDMNLKDPRALYPWAMVELYRGQYDEARRLAAEAVETARAIENPMFEAGGWNFEATIESAMGHAQEALDLFIRAWEFDVESFGDAGFRNPNVAWFDAMAGDAFRAASERDRGREVMQKIREHSLRPMANLGYAIATLNESKIDRDEGNALEAESLAFEALAMFHDFESPVLMIDALEVIAELAVELEAHEEAVRVLGATQAARDQIGYVRFPVERPGYESSLAEARVALGEAFDQVWAEGLALSLDEAVDYVSRGRGARRRPTVGWSALTPAELRVAGLVAKGLKNKEIAERLFVSPYTVETHLKNMFAKLGFSSRAELASEATRRLAS